MQNDEACKERSYLSDGRCRTCSETCAMGYARRWNEVEQKLHDKEAECEELRAKIALQKKWMLDSEALIVKLQSKISEQRARLTRIARILEPD